MCKTCVPSYVDLKLVKAMLQQRVSTFKVIQKYIGKGRGNHMLSVAWKQTGKKIMWSHDVW